MRNFLKILSMIARCFLLLEKSLSNGSKDDIISEIKESREQLVSLKKEVLQRLEKKDNATVA